MSTPCPDAAPGAETAYLFRHALLRDAAYQLQLPAERAVLHAMAFRLLETTYGGQTSTDSIADRLQPRLPASHADPFALELAKHAAAALAGGAEPPELARAHLHWLRRGGEHAEREFRLAEASRCWDEFADLSTGIERAEALRRSGRVDYQSGRSSIAVVKVEEALRLFRAAGERHFEAYSLEERALCNGALGATDSVEQDLKDALEILSGLYDGPSAARVLANLANWYQRSGRIEQAREAFEGALAAHRLFGNHRGEAIAICSLGQNSYLEGKHAEAESTLLDGLRLCREHGLKQVEAMALSNLGAVYRVTGQVQKALELRLAALELHRMVGNCNNEGIELGNLATLYRETGRPELAERYAHEALALLRESGNRRGQATVLDGLANTQRVSGQWELSERTHREALAIQRQCEDLRGAGITLGNLGSLLALMGRVAEARQAYAQSLELARKSSDRVGEGTVAGALAGLDRDAGHHEQAAAGYTEALGIFREVVHRRGEGRTLCELAILELARARPDAARDSFVRGDAILAGLSDATSRKELTSAMRAACAKAGVPPFDG